MQKKKIMEQQPMKVICEEHSNSKTKKVKTNLK